MPDLYWKKVDPLGIPPELPCLITNDPVEGFPEEIWVAHNSFDYHDADWWFPYPRFPFDMPTFITNDNWIMNLYGLEKD